MHWLHENIQFSLKRLCLKWAGYMFSCSCLRLAHHEEKVQAQFLDLVSIHPFGKGCQEI